MCIHTHVYVPSNIFRHFKFENVAIRVCHEFMEHAFFFSRKHPGRTDYKIQKDATLCRMLMAGRCQYLVTTTAGTFTNITCA